MKKRTITSLIKHHPCHKIAGYEIQVDVNSAFVRENKINRLVGCNKRLHQALGEESYPPIEGTLRRMYEAAA